MATSEPEINIALAETLDALRANWRVSGEQLGRTQGPRRPDILAVAHGSAPVVIETEVAPAATVEADARARLGVALTDGAIVNAAIAVRVPARFRELEGEALRSALRRTDAALEYALLSGASGEQYDRFPDAGWLVGGATDLARLAYQASIPLRAIENAANRLQQGVTAASERLSETIRLRPDVGPWIAERVHQQDGPQTRRMAMAIVTNALVFHANLAGSHGIQTLDALRNPNSERFSKMAVLNEWRKILSVNYYPIFDIAHQIMQQMPEGLASDVFGLLSATAAELISEGVTRSHDLSGVVFQRLIADRKYLATYYTTPSAAALLATLALPDREADYSQFKIADFSCGTGTLLSAGYRRLAMLHEKQGGNAEEFHRHAMEQGIVGADIMPMSVHLAASMLASAYPTEQFANTRLYTLPYARQTGGHYALGSLDLLSEDAQIQPLFRTGAPMRATGKGAKEVTQLLDVHPGEFDLVIMNPPFTRPTNHAGERSEVPNPAFAGLGTDEEGQDIMGKRAKSLGRGTCADGNAGIASQFIALADKMVADSGTVAVVLPLAVLQGYSWRKVRNLFYDNYRDVIVVSIAAARAIDKSFSAETNMGEALIIAKKSAGATQDKRGVFVNLTRRPKNPMEAEEIGEQVLRMIKAGGVRTLEAGPAGGSVIFVGQEQVDEVLDCPLPEGGQWSAAGIIDIGLAQTAYQLTIGRLWLSGRFESDAYPLPVTPLENIGRLGFIDRDINEGGGRGAFDILRSYPKSADYPTLWWHESQYERTMLLEPDAEARIRTGKEQRAQEIWETATRLHHNRNFGFSAGALAAAFTERPTLGGSAWPNIILNQPDREMAHALWANSTLGCLLYWWHSSKQQSGRGRMPHKQAEKMPTLNVDALSDDQVAQASAIFEAVKARPMRPLNEAAEDEVRQELDRRLLVDVLDVPSELMPSLDLLRRKLCDEPSVHGDKKSKAAAPLTRKPR